jgi:hypothetical protein
LNSGHCQIRSSRATHSDAVFGVIRRDSRWEGKIIISSIKVRQGIHDCAWFTAEIRGMDEPTNVRNHIARKCQGPRKVGLQTASTPSQLETDELDFHVHFNKVSIIHTSTGEIVLLYMP